MTAPATATTTLEGTVDRIRFANPEQGFAVLGMQHGRERFVAVGALAGAEPGEVLELEGAWGRSSYGPQFEAVRFRKLRPSSVEGIRRFLTGIDGVGFHTAHRLVAHWGEATLARLEADPDAAREVPGIGPQRAAEIFRAVRGRSERDNALIALESLGLLPALALKVLRWAGDRDPVARVKANPYALCALDGVGFLTADSVAARLGFESHDPRRIDAGILHALAEAAGDGHTCRPPDALAAAASKLLQVAKDLVLSRLDGMLERGREVVANEHGAVFLRRLWQAEEDLAERIRELLVRGAEPVAFVEDPHGLELSAEQRRAVERALAAKVFVLTGGPGTGKTTITRAIVRSLKAHGLRLHLASPTGRAAERLREATGEPASTIHRLLEYHPLEGFRVDALHPLPGDVLIVDEASMLDVHLARHLFEAVTSDCRVILVGDADQLPSVGPGRVLCDLIESGAVATARLERIFRQAEASLIVRGAHRIRRGELPESGTDPAVDDLFIALVDDPEEAARILVETVVERIPRVLGLDARDVQVLTPMRKGPLGTESLNRELRRRLNPRGRKILKDRFRLGDRVMQTRNNYSQGTMNGEMGVVVAYDEERKRVAIDFGGETKSYKPAELADLDLAYACTIHKSQGSEYPCVVVALHRGHHVLLQRDLFYTALTRARRLAVLVGDEGSIARAVRTVGGNRRTTGLAARLRTIHSRGSLRA